MNHGNAFSLHTFVPSGDPIGIRVVEKDNWSGCVIALRRGDLEEALALGLSALEGPGVYILRGLDDDSEDLIKLYIGESDAVGNRVKAHSPRSADKRFWTEAFCCTSKDANLNKGHVQYLERKLVQLAYEARSCVLENERPESYDPSSSRLSQADVASAETYIENALICLRALGVREFERTELGRRSSNESGLKSPDVQDVELSGKSVQAAMRVEDGSWVVKEGSQAVLEPAPSWMKREEFEGYRNTRQQLIDDGILQKSESGECFVFTKDHEFRSPTEAAGVILGNSSSGLTAWKSDGRTLGAILDSG